METNWLNMLAGNAPSAVAVIVVVVLFLKEHREDRTVQSARHQEYFRTMETLFERIDRSAELREVALREVIGANTEKLGEVGNALRKFPNGAH